MSCNACECVMGDNYELYGGNCSFCGAVPPSQVGTYVGMDDKQLHVFRLHPMFICPGCGMPSKWAKIPCSFHGDVTEEFRLLYISREKDAIR